VFETPSAASNTIRAAAYDQPAPSTSGSAPAAGRRHQDAGSTRSNRHASLSRTHIVKPLQTRNTRRDASDLDGLNGTRLVSPTPFGRPSGYPRSVLLTGPGRRTRVTLDRWRGGYRDRRPLRMT
jgi:hypothetical protein